MKIIFIFVLLITIIFFSCKKDMSPVISEFSGITHTLSDGTIISDDLEDWQPRITIPLPTQIRPEDYLACLPAYPNPFYHAYQKTITITFAIKQLSRVKILIKNSPIDNGSIIFDKEMDLGYHIAEINGTNLSSGIYRVSISVNTEGQEFNSYGDIQVIK